MPRRGQIKHRAIAPDPKYKNVTVQDFVNRVMTRGKKTVAQKLVYGAFDVLGEKTKKNPLEVFESALRNVGPSIEVKPRRVCGATLQVPVEVSNYRRTALALRWIIQYSRARGGKTYSEKLAGELLDAASNQGASIKRKEEVHKMAEANRAFAHYRW